MNESDARDMHSLAVGAPAPQASMHIDDVRRDDETMKEWVLRVNQMRKEALASTAAPQASMQAGDYEEIKPINEGKRSRLYTQAQMDAALASTAAPQAQAPEAVTPASSAPAGFKLVPLEPTDKMTFIGQSLRYQPANSIGSIYVAMIDAAPPQAPAKVLTDAAATCLAFFACVIKSGEPWTDVCQSMYAAALATPAAAPEAATAPSDAMEALVEAIERAGRAKHPNWDDPAYFGGIAHEFRRTEVVGKALCDAAAKESK